MSDTIDSGKVPRLTILMPLKGRHLFTLRFLFHADRSRLPYRFVIADGDVRPALAELLENSKVHFPNLNIDYVRYPDDSNFARFYAKMADVVGRVKTPYVMQVDNDDFLAPAGIERALDFLEANPDYTAHCSSTAVFTVYSGLSDATGGLRGRLNHLRYGSAGSYRATGLRSPKVAERLHHGGRSTAGLLYYAVFRTEALATVLREVVDIDFSDLQVHEIFFTLRALTLGKARAEEAMITYLRQIGTSHRSAFKKTWLHHLLRSRFTDDVNATVDGVAAIAAAADGADIRPIEEDIRDTFELRFAHFLRFSHGQVADVKRRLQARVPGLVNWVKNRRRYSVGRERSAMLRQLAAAGASREYVAQVRDELAVMEQVMAGDAFADFVRPYLPMLGPKEWPASGKLAGSLAG